MKRPILDEFERFVIRETNSYYKARLELFLAKKHFMRSISILRLFGIIDNLLKYLKG